MSAIGQNRPVIIEIKGFKTSHFKESNTAPRDRKQLGSVGHVECPQSEPANHDIQLGPAGLVTAANCKAAGDQSRNVGRYLRLPIPAISITGNLVGKEESKPAISIARPTVYG
jgi:hypothetical protein